ncbi:MAG: hypothetical protein U0361_13895 [Nitrospiraceae bacterium]
MTITDNGIGFDMEAVLRDPEKWDHFAGSRNPTKRARFSGAKRRSGQEGGVARIVLKVPLARQGDDSQWKRLKVLIADDHRVVREGLAAILKTKDDINVVGKHRMASKRSRKTPDAAPGCGAHGCEHAAHGRCGRPPGRSNGNSHIGIVALTM